MEEEKTILKELSEKGKATCPEIVIGINIFDDFGKY